MKEANVNGIKGLRVLITGGSSGLGYEMAGALLSEGARVMITARGTERLRQAEKALGKLGEVYALEMDVRSEQSTERAAEETGRILGGLDMLICNAGIGGNEPGLEALPKPHGSLDIPVSSVRNIIETNLIGYFTTVRYFVPLMEGSPRGRVVYVTTSDRTMTARGQIPYGPSKAGAEAMTKILSDELSEKGITVNLLCPGGFTDTAMAPKGAVEAALKEGRTVLSPDIMNEAVLFLASEDSDGITGEKFVGKEFVRPVKEREKN